MFVMLQPWPWPPPPPLLLLLSSTHPPRTAQLGNADIIQPGLVQLQPSLDEYMDTLEPLPSLQGSLLPTFNPPLGSSCSFSLTNNTYNNNTNNTSLYTTTSSRHKKPTIAGSPPPWRSLHSSPVEPGDNSRSLGWVERGYIPILAFYIVYLV